MFLRFRNFISYEALSFTLEKTEYAIEIKDIVQILLEFENSYRKKCMKSICRRLDFLWELR